MDRETRIWNLLKIIVPLITCIPPIIAAYDLSHRSSIRDAIPEKSIELTKSGPLNPLWRLNMENTKVILKLSVDKETYDNLFFETFTLHNTGKVPVMPADYYEPITVRVNPPWKIITVEPFVENKIDLGWHRISDRCFEAKPILINPGDFIFQQVYLTNTKYDYSQDRLTILKSQIEVNARIANMRGFARPPSPPSFSVEFEPRTPTGWFVVFLSGRAILFTVISASIFLFWYLLLLQKARLLVSFGYKSYLIIVGFAVLSFSSAEVLAYFIFGIYPLSLILTPPSLDWKTQWQNWLILTLHICISIYLYRRSKLRPKVAISVDT